MVASAFAQIVTARPIELGAEVVAIEDPRCRNFDGKQTGARADRLRRIAVRPSRQFGRLRIDHRIVPFRGEFACQNHGRD
jgi:hypothetical protein